MGSFEFRVYRGFGGTATKCSNAYCEHTDNWKLETDHSPTCNWKLATGPLEDFPYPITDEVANDGDSEPEGLATLAKPFSLEELDRAVERALA